MNQRRLTERETENAIHWLGRRCRRMWPDDPSHGAEVMFAATMRLSGMTPLVTEDNRTRVGLVDADVTHLLELKFDEGRFVIGTMSGLSQIADLGLDDDEAIAGVIRRDAEMALDEGVPLDEWGPWHCLLCKRIYPDDYEPETCEACGTRLVRSMKQQIEEE